MPAFSYVTSFLFKSIAAMSTATCEATRNLSMPAVVKED